MSDVTEKLEDMKLQNERIEAQVNKMAAILLGLSTGESLNYIALLLDRASSLGYSNAVFRWQTCLSTPNCTGLHGSLNYVQSSTVHNANTSTSPVLNYTTCPRPNKIFQATF